MLAKLTAGKVRILRKEMTGFGRQVWTFMGSRGVTSQRELSRLILKHSRESVSYDSLRNYLSGRSAAPPTFPRQVVAALDLDEQEKAALAMAYAFGQDLLDTEEREAS